MFLYLIRLESNLFYIIYTDLQFIFLQNQNKKLFLKTIYPKKNYF